MYICVLTFSQALVTLAVFRLCTSDKDHCAAETLKLFPIFFIMRIYGSLNFVQYTLVSLKLTAF